MRMGTSLYRICAGLCISVLLGAVSLAAAPEKKNKGPRAIAVVRWQLDDKGTPTRPFLIPVAILVESKLYDAGMYQPTPRPFALDPGTLYEAQDKGELLGFFTIENAVRGKGSSASWIGLGTWKSESPGLEFDPSKAIDLRTQARPAIATAQVPDDEEHPAKKKTKIVYDEQGRPVEHPSDDDDQSAQPTGKGGKREP